MHIGVQYYRAPFPEQRFWQDDFKQIKDSGLDTVQLWILWGWVESKPGQFRFEDYDQLEMVIARCSVFEPSKAALAKRQLECGIPFWPHAFVTARCDIEQLLQAWNNEYACLGYGAHLYADLVAFCEQTGVRAVAL